MDGKKDGASNAKLTVQVDLEHKPDQTSHALTFGGSLQLFEREFAVNYGSQGNTSLLVAAYDGAKVDQIEFKDFVSQISQDVAAVIPRGVKIDLKRAQLAFGKIGKTSKFLFGVELGAGIRLSNLPLVGQVFDRSQTLSVVLQILAANADFETDEVKQINQLTASGVTKLPENRISVSERKVHLKASVQFSGISQQLDLPLETNVESSTAAASPGIVSTAPKDEKSVKWFTIQKAIGPLHFDRFGICLRAGNIEFLLDASLMMAGLTIALQGLAAECALTELSKGNFQPTFHLDGLGVDFKRGDLEIGGALSRNPTADLTIWGPPFSGTAHVQWYIISFDIAFGNPRPQSPEALKWEGFRKSFLPENKDVCTIAAQAGKVANQGSQGKGANETSGNQIKLYRQGQPSPSILLYLFEGELASVAIQQRPETIHLSLENHRQSAPAQPLWPLWKDEARRIINVTSDSASSFALALLHRLQKLQVSIR